MKFVSGIVKGTARGVPVPAARRSPVRASPRGSPPEKTRGIVPHLTLPAPKALGAAGGWPLGRRSPGSALDPAGFAPLDRPSFFLGLTPAKARAKGQAL
jgi:hypothetical protein